MATYSPRTEAAILAEIEETRAILREVARLPTRGRTPRTELDHSKTPDELRRLLSDLGDELAAVRNNGHVQRPRRCC